MPVCKSKWQMLSSNCGSHCVFGNTQNFSGLFNSDKIGILGITFCHGKRIPERKDDVKRKNVCSFVK